MAALYSHPDGSYEPYTFNANADGTFPAPYKATTHPLAVPGPANMKYATGDYNGDGTGDVAILYGYDDGSLRLFTALAKPTAPSRPRPLLVPTCRQLVVQPDLLQSGDFNGDGRDDLAAWYDYTDGHDTLFTFTATPQGGFNEPFASWTVRTRQLGSQASQVRHR